MMTQTLGECKIDFAADKLQNCETNYFQESRKCEKKLDQRPVGFEFVLRGFVGKTRKLSNVDSRRIIHAVKVGLALSVVSLFYLMEPLFDGVGDNAIWAIMTVVVVFEFTVGATLSKGLNRGIGTVLAGCLAVLVGYIAEKAGTIGEAIIIGASCFSLGAAATYFRFFPKIKAKYDYGVLIFILTFNMITVSGYRVDNIFRMAYERLSTIAIGSGVALVISLCIFPAWAGEDLNRSIIKRMEGLADSLEGCMLEYFEGSEYCRMDDGEPGNNLENSISIYVSSEESLATFASWEPRHGKFGFRHQWKQYVEVGSMLRHMAYCVVALDGCLRSEYQTGPISHLAFGKPCTYKVGMEVAKILHDLAESIKWMRQCPPAQTMMKNMQVSVDELKTSFRLQNLLRHLAEPLSDNDENHLNSAKSTDHHVIPTHQSSNEPQEHSRPVEIIIKDSDYVHLPDQGKGKQESSSELFSPAVTEKDLTINKEENNGIILSIESLAPKRKAIHEVGDFEAVPLATVASLVLEIVARLEHVIETVHKLGKLAVFKA